ncbi:MAG: chitobiase/beta-hexosaminidase C-terminal domain-containing protein [Candidatus Hydrogenedentes bacterium]|nr:chitobiase/beta-hexosaminidase C-terminal domain-containing protein [Candidatus Hydrogenedentota bacterium]
MSRTIASFILSCALVQTVVASEPAGVSKRFPAFPEAEGAGAYTPGGRGGRVLLVTTLDDYNPKTEKPIPGSLRAAVDTKGPRTIVINVAGYIDLKAALVISEPHVTIAGQKAPGDGVCLRYEHLDIKTHDVIIRYLRVRPGDTVKKELDGISCSGQNVILDHCSVSFGIDETLSTNGDAGNVTVQWCYITESLNSSVHHKGSHGYGSLISGVEPITYHHDLYAFHRSRNPRPGIGLLDFRNNVIYGWGDVAGYCGNDPLRLNYVANYLRPGTYSKDKVYAFRPGGLLPRIHIADSVFYGLPDKTKNNALLIKAPDSVPADDVSGKGKPLTGEAAEEAIRSIRVMAAFPTETVKTDTAEIALDRVLKEGGATLPARDAYDTRVADLVRNAGGRIINSQDEVGGWPELKQGTAPADTDGDGMPDAWEKRNGLDPNDASDVTRDCNGDGFTNIEKYLNDLDPKKPFAWIYPPEVSREGGAVLPGPVKVLIASATPNAEINYTLDGSEPTAASKTYDAPFELTQTAMVRAKAFLNGAASHVRNELMEVFTLHDATPPANTAQGLDYAYYENGKWRGFPDWSPLKPLKTGVAETVGIGPSDREFGYGLKFTGYVRVAADGIYTFYSRSNELSRLAVDDVELVVTQSRKRELSGRIALKAGLHKIDASCYFGTEGSQRTFEISFEGPQLPKQVIPAKAYFHVIPK